MVSTFHCSKKGMYSAGTFKGSHFRTARIALSACARHARSLGGFSRTGRPESDPSGLKTTLICATYVSPSGMPGGGVQHGEDPVDSLRREVEEESGLTVTVGPLLDVLSDVRTLPDGTDLHTVRLIYRVARWSGTLRAEREGTTDAVRWVEREELATLPLAHYVEEVVARFV